MDDRPIVFFDSGVGGLPYLAWARERLPDETFVYVADRENFPYGPKTTEQIFAAVDSAIRSLMKIFDPKIIVIACNTATVVAIAGLRELYPHMPFIGVVPAVKPASEQSVHRKIGVLATRRTVEDAFLKNLIDEFASDCLVVKIAGGNIVEFVEYKFLESSKEERYEIFSDAVAEFSAANVDSIVLGCTHFLYLIDEIREKVPDGMAIIDSRAGVGNQLIRRLDELKLRASSKDRDRLFVTGAAPVESRYHDFARLFSLESPETLVRDPESR